jgi:hypothetical protein
MAYTATTYTNPNTLLTAIKDFLSANGWTINSWADDTSSRQTHANYNYTGGKRLHVQKTASDSTVMYFNFRSVIAGVIFSNFSTNSSSDYSGYKFSELRGIGINGSTGYNGSNQWEEQPGAPVAGSLSTYCGGAIQGIPVTGGNCWFFQNGDTVTIVVEYATGSFMWMAFGCLEKAGTYTGGQFYSASMTSYAPGYQFGRVTSDHRSDYRTAFMADINTANYAGSAAYFNADSVADWRHSGYEGNQSSDYSHYLRCGAQTPWEDDLYWTRDKNTMSHFVYDRTPNAFNGQHVLFPLLFWGKRASGRWSPLGKPTGIRSIGMGTLSAEKEFSIESDTWKVFPANCMYETGYDSNLNKKVGFAVKK